MDAEQKLLLRDRMVRAATYHMAHRGRLSTLFWRVAQALETEEEVIRELFADENRLLDAVLDRLEGEFVEPLLPLLRGLGGSPADIITRLHRRLGEHFAREPEMTFCLHSIAQEVGGKDHPCASRVERLVDNLKQSLGEVFVRIPGIGQPDVAAAAYLYALWGIGVNARRGNGHYSIRELSDGFLSLMSSHVVTAMHDE